MQYAVIEPRLDAVAVDILREGENPLVIAVGIFIVDPLVPAVLPGRAAPGSSRPVARA
jgi:hypothetical protein